MKKYTLIIIIFCLFSNFLYSEEKLIELRDIRIKGNNIVSEFEIRENILLKAQEYTIKNFNKLIDQSLELLYATNNFKNISFEFEKDDTSVIYLKLEEWPVLNKFEIIGLKNVKSSDDDTETFNKISELIDYLPGDFIRDNHNKQIIAKIREYLRTEGYYFSEVNVRMKKNEDSKYKVDLIFDVFEGPEVKVKYFQIFSKNEMSDLKKKIMKFKFKVDKGDVFKPEEFKADIAKLKIKFWNKGYIQSKISTDIVEYKRENKIGIKLFIEKGEQFTVEDFKVVGNAFFGSDTLLKEITLKKNEFFNYDNYMESIEGIKKVYSNEGFIESKVEPQQKFVGDTKVVIVFHISEGNKIYIQDILIKGNIKTKEKVIKRELLVKKGEVMNSNKVNLSRRNLVMTNFFEKVDLKVLPGKDASHKILVFEVEEGRTGTLSFGAGYSSVDKFVGFLEVSKNNFDLKDLWSFTGKGQKVHLRVEYGKERKNFEVGWSDPWFNDDLNDTMKPSPEKPLFLGYNLYKLTRDPDDYEIERTGGNIKLGRRFGVYNRGYLKYQIEEIKIDDIEEDAPYDIKEEGEKTELQSSISLELIRNTTDSPRWPTLGYIIEFSNEVSGGFLGGDIDFIKTELDFSYFIPGFKTKLGRQVLAFHAFYGSLKNIFNSDDEPSYEKYFLGGSDTVRGYGDRDIKFFKNVTYTDGTTGLESFGGKSEMYFNIEYRIPLVKDTISSVLFFDGGNLHLDSFSFPKDTWRYGFGLGFRITTPMGNLRLDWAKRLNETYPGAGDRGETEIHFNIGNMF